MPANPASGCVRGLQSECSCAGGRTGIAVCGPDGSFGACTCGEAISGAGAPGTPGGAPIPAAPGAPAAPGLSQPDAPVAVPEVPPAPPKPLLASGVKITQLALYQPVKTPLVDKGVAVSDRIAPVIAHKRALLRVFVETLPGYTPREISASLQFDPGSGMASMMPIAAMGRIERASTDADLKSTLNVELPPEAMREDARYSVSLLEAPGSAMTAGAAPDPDARFPKEDGQFADLGARDPGPFRVMIIPYRYQGDDSGRLPAVDDAEMDKYRAYLSAQYPASRIELELHEPVDYEAQIGQERGWVEWLESHCALRTDEDPDPKVFYYGMIAPRASWREYGGGVAGISNLPGPAANYGRCSVGIGFEGFAFVAAHELGHALGLEHAPCGTGEASPFPYEDSSIGVWGYDFTTGKLVSPDKAHDLMSYCDPPFMSDYNYRRLFNRIRFLNAQFDLRTDDAAQANAPTRYHRVLIDENGAARVRGISQFSLPPGGPEELRSLTLLDAAGEPVAQSDAYYFPFSEQGAGVWLVPDSGAHAVRLDDVGDVQLY